ncbi:hypothetical protein TRFO_07447 [Tritrichomonas foetus]|uniref:RRM domain-containing protein n=1 Tax=Tritrichomonas foetus TaxID=1144522 RepID=A0A1J4JRU7_9EUKA|nr:hypothetical protein TRFO_07447 [Tritrichomonas foetus]|eukprot:OHT01863.1 hypothetical protein TRFO_07447 [Tritrichomonas foetus]
MSDSGDSPQHDEEKKEEEIEESESESNEEIDITEESDNSNEIDEKSIFIGNLSYDANEEDLKHIFEEIGTVVQIKIPRRPNGQLKGVAFVLFENKEIAEEAVKKFDGSEILNRKAFIKLASEPHSPPANKSNSADYRFKSNKFHNRYNDRYDKYNDRYRNTRQEYEYDNIINDRRQYYARSKHFSDYSDDYDDYYRRQRPFDANYKPRYNNVQHGRRDSRKPYREGRKYSRSSYNRNPPIDPRDFQPPPGERH